MSSSDPIRRFHEGRVTLPAGYVDRTVNVFAPNDDHAASINISRDTLQPTETLSDYIDRQCNCWLSILKPGAPMNACQWRWGKPCKVNACRPAICATANVSGGSRRCLS